MAVNHFRNGADVDAAISEGARWGMTSERLQGAVRESLEND
jgi:hypothetical protein